ncbi:hypothetical protein ID866_9186 [Astraeus odoratus]|nr:hypothetical protein ID866_9186 [Astraeus odoratus]
MLAAITFKVFDEARASVPVEGWPMIDKLPSPEGLKRSCVAKFPAQRPHRRVPDRVSALPDPPSRPFLRAAPADTPAQAALGPAAPVTFDLIGAPERGLGIPMLELAVRSGNALERMLVGATDHVGTAIGKALYLQHVRLVIPWGRVAKG